MGLIGIVIVGGNPVQFIDPNGTDAIVITAPEGAGGFGHTSALFEDENGTWQYFYWGNTEAKLVETKLTKKDVNVSKFNTIQISEYLSVIPE